MLPSRGLRPHQMVPSAFRHSSPVRSGASRKFSSVPRRAGLSTLPYRTSPLRSAYWRTGATSSSNVLLSVSSVRYGSWYAPWSWGRSSTPSDVTPTPTSPTELAAEPVPESAITSATPELAPAGIDQPAVVDSTVSPTSPKTVEDLLGLDPTLVTDVPPLVDPGATISYWGNLKDLGLDYGWGTSALFENLVELSYLYSGLGWSGSIALSAVAIRCGLFFFQYQGSDAGARLAAMKPVLQPLMDELEAAKRAGNEEKVMACKMKQKAIMSEFGGALWKSLSTPVLQMMLGFGAFRCLRGMTTLPVPGMTTEGWLWFTDLTIADPYYILPMATGGIMYAIIKNGGETGMNTEMQQAGWQKQMMVVMPLMMVIITSFQPAGLQLYFVCSAVLGGVTSQLLRTPAFRRLTGLRPLPSQKSNAVYDKVVKGEIKLSALRGADGKIRYQAPGASRSSSPSSKNAPSTASYATTTSGVNIKPGITLPPHMRAAAPAKVPQNYADRAHDFEQGAPVGSLSAKLDWFRRNYTPKFIWRRMKRSIMKDSRTASEMMEQDRKKKAREATRRYEIERKRRMEGR